ncbi:hypothetical protein D3C71_1574350 [compost metagenome]
MNSNAKLQALCAGLRGQIPDEGVVVALRFRFIPGQPKPFQIQHNAFKALLCRRIHDAINRSRLKRRVLQILGQFQTAVARIYHQVRGLAACGRALHNGFRANVTGSLRPIEVTARCRELAVFADPAPAECGVIEPVQQVILTV